MEVALVVLFTVVVIVARCNVVLVEAEGADGDSRTKTQFTERQEEGMEERIDIPPGRQQPCFPLREEGEKWTMEMASTRRGATANNNNCKSTNPHPPHPHLYTCLDRFWSQLQKTR